MSLRKLGLAISITALSVLSVAAMEESALAGRKGHHGHHKHHKHEHHGVKKCFHTSHGLRCYYVKSR